MAEICPVCGLPKELCMCEEIAREQQTVRISVDSRRYGKMVTVIDGIDENDIDINDLVIPEPPHHMTDAELYKEFQDGPHMRVVCGTVGDDERPGGHGLPHGSQVR